MTLLFKLQEIDKIHVLYIQGQLFESQLNLKPKVSAQKFWLEKLKGKTAENEMAWWADVYAQKTLAFMKAKEKTLETQWA